jgi:hypothetical protein
LIVLEELIIAKIIGVFSLILVIIALRVWLRISRFNSEKIERIVLNKNQLFELERNYLFFNKISEAEKQIILNRTGLILAELKFIIDPDDEFSKDEIIDIAFNISISQLDHDYKSFVGYQLKISKSKKIYSIGLDDLPLKSNSRNFSTYKIDLLKSDFFDKLNQLISQS